MSHLITLLGCSPIFSNSNRIKENLKRFFWEIFTRKVQKASIYSTFTQNGSKNCDLEQIKFLIKSPVLNQQELFSPTGYFGVPSGIKLHKVTASDIKWSAKKRDKRGQTCVEGNLRFLSHNAAVTVLLLILQILKLGTIFPLIMKPCTF